MRTTPRGTRAVLLVLLLAGPGYAQEHEHVASTNEKVGTVNFSTS